MSVCGCNNTTVILLRQGDDSNYDDNKIIFHFVTEKDLTGWKAKFALQHLRWVFDNIEDKQIELVITRDQTNSLETGRCYGWLKFVDNNNKEGTIYAQQFKVMGAEVF